MLRAWCLPVIFLLLPQSPALADAPANLGANAALKYWQAFAALPKFTKAEQEKLGECLTMPLDDRAKDFVARSAYSLRMLHHGAALKNCDWGIGWEEDGVEVRLPHTMAARTLANLVCLRPGSLRGRSKRRGHRGHSRGNEPGPAGRE